MKLVGIIIAGISGAIVASIGGFLGGGTVLSIWAGDVGTFSGALGGGFLGGILGGIVGGGVASMSQPRRYIKVGIIAGVVVGVSVDMILLYAILAARAMR